MCLYSCQIYSRPSGVAGRGGGRPAVDPLLAPLADPFFGMPDRLFKKMLAKVIAKEHEFFISLYKASKFTRPHPAELLEPNAYHWRMISAPPLLPSFGYANDPPCHKQFVLCILTFENSHQGPLRAS